MSKQNSNSLVIDIPLESILAYTKKWAFCHIPKNGGANFKREFRKDRNIPIIKHKKEFNKRIMYHQTPAWFEENYPELRGKQWICISRNPYSRYVSWFFFIRQRQKESNYTHGDWSDISFETFVRENLLEKSSKHPKYNHANWIPTNTQCHWITHNMKVFSLENDLNELEDYTQTSFADKHHNSTSHAPWQEYYTQEIKDIVYARYEQDFIKFGYKK